MRHSDFIQSLKSRPKKLQYRMRFLDSIPEGWCIKNYGDWPKSGALFVYTRFPSGSTANSFNFLKFLNFDF